MKKLLLILLPFLWGCNNQCFVVEDGLKVHSIVYDEDLDANIYILHSKIGNGDRSVTHVLLYASSEMKDFTVGDLVELRKVEQ
jgi:hypothetical protein